MFTSAAIMQLVERNSLQIEKPVSAYVEHLPEDWNKITVKQLLSHTSGLPDIQSPDGNGLISEKGQDSAWVKVQTMPLQSGRGEKFNYNATNYLLLQKIIEKRLKSLSKNLLKDISY
ncbi:MAG: beta-lactamase family protein [Chryseobacterium sp.]|nr:serine hydrolase domain-containing protein [Chryseobacterium sp.]MCJ7932688.1 beta-lactamase family protein [Chryseobacterium sp.]